MTKTQTGNAAREDAATAQAAGESLKRHGDKLQVAAGGGAKAAATGAATGDSPKPHGDKLAKAVEAAAKR